MKNLKDIITEKLKLNKDLKINTIPIDIKGDTKWTDNEIEKVHSFADTLSVKPKVIDNYDPSVDDTAKYTIFLKYDDKNEAYICITKDKEENYYTTCLISKIDYFMPFSKNKSTGFDTLEEIFEKLPNACKQLNFFDHIPD